MRGLKLIFFSIYNLPLLVASFTDAWIETCWENGDKTKMRVASFTDAWIETYRRALYPLRRNVASFTDAWIETIFV